MYGTYRSTITPHVLSPPFCRVYRTPMMVEWCMGHKSTITPPVLPQVYGTHECITALALYHHCSKGATLQAGGNSVGDHFSFYLLLYLLTLAALSSPPLCWISFCRFSWCFYCLLNTFYKWCYGLLYIFILLGGGVSEVWLEIHPLNEIGGCWRGRV